jgi:hypothetical protein
MDEVCVLCVCVSERVCVCVSERVCVCVTSSASALYRGSQSVEL